MLSVDCSGSFRLPTQSLYSKPPVVADAGDTVFFNSPLQCWDLIVVGFARIPQHTKTWGILANPTTQNRSILHAAWNEAVNSRSKAPALERTALEAPASNDKLARQEPREQCVPRQEPRNKDINPHRMKYNPATKWDTVFFLWPVQFWCGEISFSVRIFKSGRQTCREIV